jgi:uncharacterized repeat protein (TIGR01451 family)
LTYYNSGSGDATGVIIADMLPADVTFVNSSLLNYSVNGTTYTWIIGDLPANSGGTITITVTVNVGVGDGNTATFDYADANGNSYDQLTDYADVTVTAPVLSFSKTASQSTADPGDTIVYSLTYTNSGSGDATGVIITDTIPDDVTFVNSSLMNYSVSGTTYTWIIGDLPANSGGTITITVTVNVGVGDGTLLHNTATFDYADANGNSYDQLTDYADVTVTAPVFDTFTYTLTYNNSGSGAATGVTITDTIPVDVTFVSSTPMYSTVSGTTYTWNIGNLSAYSGGTITITVTVNVGVGDGTLLHNTATFDYADANGNSYDQLTDYADVTVTAPVLSFSKTVSQSTANPGDTLVYTLTYNNSGSGDATGVIVTDTIPDDVTFVNSSLLNYSVNGTTYTWIIGDLPAYSGGTITITVTVSAGVGDGTLLHNTATFDYADANGNSYDQLTDYADVTVTAPVMSFTKRGCNRCYNR